MYLLYGIAGAILLYVGAIGAQALQDSSLFSRPDRLNVAFYGEEAIVLSFGLADEVNYVVSLSHEEKIVIPGGYNQYPLGSLGKLVALQKDPDIMQRAFSSMLSAYVNYYVSPRNPAVYQKPDTDAPQYKRTALIGKLFSHQHQANMNIFDRLFVTYLIAKHRQQDYVVLRSAVRRDVDDGTHIFSEKNFQKKYKGFFYYSTLREEGMEVQIKYNVYKSALTLSRIIEGQGIRIVDLTRTEKQVSRCLVVTSAEVKSNTVRFLAKALRCPVEKGATEGVDVVIYLGKELEKIWE